MRFRCNTVVLKALALTTLAVLAPACAQQAVSSKGAQEIALTPAAAVAGRSVVPAGIAFDASVDDAIDTRVTRPGAKFSVTLLEPLRDMEGRIVVPAGSKVRGVVYSTGAIEAPHLTLDFQNVETPTGFAPIAVRVLSSEADRYQTWTEPAGYIGREETLMSMPQGYEAAAASAFQPPGGMPIALRPGAKLRLELTRPVFVATSSSSP